MRNIANNAFTRYGVEQSSQFNAFESLYAITRVKRNIRNSRDSSNGPSRDLPQKKGVNRDFAFVVWKPKNFKKLAEKRGPYFLN